ncbi:hypothetical protein FOA52_011679 [Chlamydomonas sp. UWO 241]|nr:hypothetical protein FOA52_011679 [Chlamydomonas sp. UWO 241]
MAGPEFAFIGKSNVGKSSIVNLLTRDPKLAKVSKTPGKTRTLNHFLINTRWLFVDCPGYGYARVSKTDRAGWHALTKEYFLQRASLAHIFLLVDASSPLDDDDVSAALWLSDNSLPWSLVFTKLDDVPAAGTHPLANMTHFVKTLAGLNGGVDTPYVPTSCATGLGRTALLQYIASLRAGFTMPLVWR